jgi:hypothetical protein
MVLLVFGVMLTARALCRCKRRPVDHGDHRRRIAADLVQAAFSVRVDGPNIGISNARLPNRNRRLDAAALKLGLMAFRLMGSQTGLKGMSGYLLALRLFRFTGCRAGWRSVLAKRTTDSSEGCRRLKYRGWSRRNKELRRWKTLP